MQKQVDVAIGIILNQQQVLVGWRQSHQHQGNKYEFPGGKVEAGETPIQACRREIEEEVGIDIKDWFKFAEIIHEYDDLVVHLHVFACYLPTQARAQIQPDWQWYPREALRNLNFPKANQALLDALLWPQQLQQQGEVFVDQQQQHVELIYLQANALEHMQRQVGKRYLVECQNQDEIAQAEHFGADAVVMASASSAHAVVFIRDGNTLTQI